ncbi:MAG: secondary thiamine-phosphate synthase enzyme YjbQ [Rhodospirillales bacterium]|nr:secondary thiamine-phosphate synthase enzyme YjbQ [Rhodospirillales bacterium]
MIQKQTALSVSTQGQALYEVTGEIAAWIKQSGISQGLLTVFCRHTSASLTIQENADPDVQRDLLEYFKRQVPENQPWMRHTLEGADDMPAHIKGALTDVSLNIPVNAGKMTLGTWQGLFLFEHRASPHNREIVLHLLGEGRAGA